MELPYKPCSGDPGKDLSARSGDVLRSELGPLATSGRTPKVTLTRMSHRMVGTDALPYKVDPVTLPTVAISTLNIRKGSDTRKRVVHVGTTTSTAVLPVGWSTARGCSSGVRQTFTNFSL